MSDNAPQRITIPGIHTPVLAYYVVTVVTYGAHPSDSSTLKRYFRRYDAALAYYNAFVGDEYDTKEIRVSAVTDSESH